MYVLPVSIIHSFLLLNSILLCDILQILWHFLIKGDLGFQVLAITVPINIIV